MKIAVLPGDGIGPEIVNEAVKVLTPSTRSSSSSTRRWAAPATRRAVIRCPTRR